MVWESIVWFFKKILELIDKYGLSKMIQAAMIVAIVLIGVSTINKCQTPDIITAYLDRQLATHDSENQKRVEIDPQVREQLLRCINSTQSNRAFVLEMHNGVSNPSGLPFRYCEMTYEEITSKSEYMSDQFDRVNMSNYPIFTYLNEKDLFIGTIDELSEIDLKMANRFKANKINYIALKLINGHNKPLAIMGVDFSCEGKKTENEKFQIISNMSLFGDKISSLLDSQEK